MDKEKLAKMTNEQLIELEKATRYMIGRHPYRLCIVYQHVRSAIHAEMERRELK